MDQETYLLTQSRVLTLADSVLALPLTEFLAAIDRVQALGGILFPTLYRAAGDRLGHIEALARALRIAQTQIRLLSARDVPR